MRLSKFIGRIRILIFLLIFSNGIAFSQTVNNLNIVENLFDFEHSFEFAQYLESQKAYQMALDEFKRCDEMNPGKVEVREAILRLCAKNEQPELGLKLYESWDYHPYLVPANLRNQYIGLSFLSRDFDRFERKLKDGLGLKEPEKSRIELHLALYKQDWDFAYSKFEAFEIQHVMESRETFGPVLDAISTIRYHNPTQGALLSIVPGLGQAYSKQWGASLGSIALVGVSAFGAQQFLTKKGTGNVFGWACLTTCAFTYSANILGGYKAAKRYNKKQDEKIVSWLDEITVRSF